VRSHWKHSTGHLTMPSLVLIYLIGFKTEEFCCYLIDFFNVISIFWCRQAHLPCFLKALKVIIDAQKISKDQNNKGGWRYKPDSRDSDFSCSGWALMALRSARLNGAQIPPEAIKDAVEYILRRHDENEGSFGYTDTKSHAVTLTGAGILCLSLCGEHSNPAIARASGYLMKNYEKLPKENYCFYGMYYAAQGLFQMGGDEWKTFSQWMYDTWIPKQFEDGHWDRHEQDTYYQTAMVVLAFTVPYRQLPIYQRDETVDE